MDQGHMVVGMVVVVVEVVDHSSLLGILLDMAEGMAWVVVVVQPGMVVDMVACKGVACKVACKVACMVVCMVSVVYMVSYPVFPFHLCRLYRLYHPLVYIFSSCPSFSYLQSLLVVALKGNSRNGVSLEICKINFITQGPLFKPGKVRIIECCVINK